MSVKTKVPMNQAQPLEALGRQGREGGRAPIQSKTTSEQADKPPRIHMMCILTRCFRYPCPASFEIGHLGCLGIIALGVPYFASYLRCRRRAAQPRPAAGPGAGGGMSVSSSLPDLLSGGMSMSGTHPHEARSWGPRRETPPPVIIYIYIKFKCSPICQNSSLLQRPH